MDWINRNPTPAIVVGVALLFAVSLMELGQKEGWERLIAGIQKVGLVPFFAVWLVSAGTGLAVFCGGLFLAIRGGVLAGAQVYKRGLATGQPRVAAVYGWILGLSIGFAGFIAARFIGMEVGRAIARFLGDML